MKTAVVLFNLGGPDSLDAVEPFLKNLFSDPAIISVPGLLRPIVARLIARRRATTARGFYELLGGGSPLLAETRSQAEALESAMGEDCRVFIAMRYWHPLTEEAIAEVESFDPDRILLLPLYPQYSTTTTGSSLQAFESRWATLNHRAEVRAICCYHDDPAFIEAFADQVKASLDQISARNEPAPVRILFSAHGLPQKIVDRGDPYAWQVTEMAEAVKQKLVEGDPASGALDHVVCFQSRVGPVTWLQPYIDDEIRRAAADGVGCLVVPIAFVSEHSETLVELDIEFRKLAENEGVPFYDRMPTLSSSPGFIAALKGLAERGLQRENSLASAHGDRVCPLALVGCPCPSVSPNNLSQTA